MAVVNPVSGSFTATGSSDSLVPVFGGERGKRRYFNLSISGTFVGTVKLQRSFDGGTTWFQFGSDYTGIAQEQHFEFEGDVEYRLECTAYTSGTIVYRLSQ